MPRDFHVTDVLTITTGNLVSNRHMDGVYDILNHMTGESIYTHQIPRVMRECQPALLRQHPQLAEADANGITPENLASRTAEWVAAYGETLSVAPLTEDQHERIDPISELAEMVPPDRVVVVRPE